MSAHFTERGRPTRTMKLKIPKTQADLLLNGIGNSRFQNGRIHWKVDKNDIVKAQSVLWLFCWAKASASPASNWNQTGHAVIKIFDQLFDVPFHDFDHCNHINLRWARDNRYTSKDIETDLTTRLQNCAIPRQSYTPCNTAN
jgi:hypothetical protein